MADKWIVIYIFIQKLHVLHGVMAEDLLTPELFW